MTRVRQGFRARVKKVNPKGNFLSPAPQQESWFQEAVGGLDIVMKEIIQVASFIKARLLNNRNLLSQISL